MGHEIRDGHESGKHERDGSREQPDQYQRSADELEDAGEPE